VWQLRVGDFRVFYDVDEDREQVIIRAIRRKGRRSTKEIL
jgi:mRNA-degrading endonuclease RelE of RelBE toxin-antitoxin system